MNEKTLEIINQMKQELPPSDALRVFLGLDNVKLPENSSHTHKEQHLEKDSE
jgi:hypothetical protein